MAELGLEFQPRGVEEGFRERLNKSPSAQEALQILSLRLPKFLQGAPIAPEDSLRAAMQPGRTPTTLIDILNEVFGGAEGQAPTAPPPGAPTPGLNPTPFQAPMPPSLGATAPAANPINTPFSAPRSAPMPTPSFTPGEKPELPGSPGRQAMDPEPAPAEGAFGMPRIPTRRRFQQEF